MIIKIDDSYTEGLFIDKRVHIDTKFFKRVENREIVHSGNRTWLRIVAINWYVVTTKDFTENFEIIPSAAASVLETLYQNAINEKGLQS